MNDRLNVELRNAKHIGQPPTANTRGVEFSYFQNFSSRKLSFGMCFARWKCFRMQASASRVSPRMPLLDYTVHTIINDRSRPQVGWIATRRIVTIVAGLFVRGQLDAMPDLKDNAGHTRIAMMAWHIDAHQAIAVLITPFHPGPTAEWAQVFMSTLLDVVPESIEKGHVWLHAFGIAFRLHIGCPTGTTGPMLPISIARVIAKLIQRFRQLTQTADLHDMCTLPWRTVEKMSGWQAVNSATVSNPFATRGECSMKHPKYNKNLHISTLVCSGERP